MNKIKLFAQNHPYKFAAIAAAIVAAIAYLFRNKLFGQADTTTAAADGINQDYYTPPPTTNDGSDIITLPDDGAGTPSSTPSVPVIYPEIPTPEVQKAPSWWVSQGRPIVYDKLGQALGTSLSKALGLPDNNSNLGQIPNVYGNGGLYGNNGLVYMGQNGNIPIFTLFQPQAGGGLGGMTSNIGGLGNMGSLGDFSGLNNMLSGANVGQFVNNVAVPVWGAKEIVDGLSGKNHGGQRAAGAAAGFAVGGPVGAVVASYGDKIVNGVKKIGSAISRAWKHIF